MADKRTQRKRSRGDEIRYAISTALEEEEEEELEADAHGDDGLPLVL